jgi:transcriptional regulator with XRE-family HTH domain
MSVASKKSVVSKKERPRNVGAVLPQGLAKRLGNVVRARRAQLGYTQEVFSENCGFFRTYMSRIETGQANMTLSALEVIAVGLKLKTSELLALAEAER